MTDANLLGPIPLSIFLMRGQRLFSLPGRRRAGPRCSAALRDGDRIACQGSLVAWAAGEGPRAGITCFQLGPALPLFLAASHPREQTLLFLSVGTVFLALLKLGSQGED